MTREEELKLAKQGAELWDWLAAHPGKSKIDAVDVFPYIAEWCNKCAACTADYGVAGCSRCPIVDCDPEYSKWTSLFSTDDEKTKAAHALAEKHRAWAARVEATK